MDDHDAIEYGKMTDSIRYWLRQVYGFIPQPVKKEFQLQFSMGLYLKGKAWDEFCSTVQPYWFEPYQQGLHMTWQQSLVLYGIDKAIRGDIPWRISIVSGHGIGKSMMLSIIILWFLFVHPDCQVACTSPGKEQMYDVLWKELAKWIERMPKEIGQMYVWEASHIRMKEAPEQWFARAKTASKENTEALAGVHADWVLMAVDEASGVEEPIFETMEGALTSGNILVFMISNGTRSIGYFYDSHRNEKVNKMWQNYAFSSLDSPRVDQKYVDGIIAKYGEDSVQYNIRVLGLFPNEGVMDDKGYVQLFDEKILNIVPFDPQWKPVGIIKGSLDASGEGQDESEWAVGDAVRAAIVAEEKKSNAPGMAAKSLTLCDKYDIQPNDFVVDAFGAGQDVGMEIAIATSTAKYKDGPWRVDTINGGEPCEDEEDKVKYVNLRAKMFYELMLACRGGLEIMDLPLTEKQVRTVKDELLSIRFKRTGNGRIQIMDKVTMKKLGFPSPNKADALSMLYRRKRRVNSNPTYQPSTPRNDFDPHTTVQ